MSGGRKWVWRPRREGYSPAAEVGEVRVRESVVGNVRGIVRESMLMARACFGEEETEAEGATEENEAERGSRCERQESEVNGDVVR